MALLFLAAGCATPSPQEDLALFDSPEERARRDLLAVYYWQTADGGAVSVVVPRQGPAETRGEVGPEMRKLLAGFSSSSPFKPRWRKTGIPVDATHRNAIDGYFAGLPAGTTERALALKPVPVQDGFESVRMEKAPLTRVRILHVSAGGELKTLKIVKGDAGDLPADVPQGGATLNTVDELFLWFARRASE